MANDEIQVSTENQREAGANHAEVAEFLRQIPQDQDQIVDWLKAKGPIYAPLIPEVQRLLDERRGFYDDEAAEHEHLHRGLNKTADAWEAHEDQAISDINSATGDPNHPPMTDMQGPGAHHHQGLEPLPYPGPARTQPADYTEPTDDSGHPPLTDIQGGAHQQGLEPLPYPGPARTQPASFLDGALSSGPKPPPEPGSQGA